MRVSSNVGLDVAMMRAYSRLEHHEVLRYELEIPIPYFDSPQAGHEFQRIIEFVTAVDRVTAQSCHDGAHGMGEPSRGVTTTLQTPWGKDRNLLERYFVAVGLSHRFIAEPKPDADLRRYFACRLHVLNIRRVASKDAV